MTALGATIGVHPAMQFNRHPHPVTGEPSWLYVDWNPPDAAQRPRTIHGLPAAPLQLVRVCLDRVELEYSWCVESGHMTAYESDPLEVHPSATHEARSAVLALIEARFGAKIAADAAKLLDDPTAFAAR